MATPKCPACQRFLPSEGTHECPSDGETIEQRFWPKVDVRSPSECWPWEAATQPSGYGNFYTVDGYEGAHRVAYRLEKGEPGDGVVRHTCDNPKCVNPRHLRLGTHAENAQDREERNSWDRSGENQPKSKLTEKEVKQIKEKLGQKTQQELAEEYGVSQSAIGSISMGRTWSDV